MHVAPAIESVSLTRFAPSSRITKNAEILMSNDLPPLGFGKAGERKPEYQMTGSYVFNGPTKFSRLFGRTSSASPTYVRLTDHGLAGARPSEALRFVIGHSS